MQDQRLFGAIADDYTGAADLAGMLSAGGVRTALVLGLQPPDVLVGLDPSYRAIVVALKTRSVLADDAVAQALEAFDRLQELDIPQLQFKYCSTFDSTDAGNIGPVTEALLEATATAFTVAVPSLPVNGRTQYLGHLFVGTRLLSDTHMREHPVTPMTESNLVRHLQNQMERPVGLIALPVVRAGAAAVRREMARLENQEIAVALVDVVTDEDLAVVADAASDLPLLTGGSGLGMMLPDVWRRAGLLNRPASRSTEVLADDGSSEASAAPQMEPSRGVLVLSGSCSSVTLEQLEVLEETGGAAIRVDVGAMAKETTSSLADTIYDGMVEEVRRNGWTAVASSAPPQERVRVLAERAAVGQDAEAVRAGIEGLFAALARRAVGEGLVDTVVVAGGETTGAVIEAMQFQVLEVGPMVDPGVPLMWTVAEPRLRLIFKSGNFGGTDFFLKALRLCGVSL